MVPEVLLSLIVEVKPAKISQVTSRFPELGVLGLDTAFNQFVLVQAPAFAVDKLAQLPDVTVHYNMPRTILSQLPAPPVPGLSLTQLDPLLGTITIPKTLIPGPKLFGLPPTPELRQPNINILPLIAAKEVLVDLTTTLTGSGILLGIIDTGLTPLHPQIFCRAPIMETVIPEPPFDFQGHGQWCATAALGTYFNTRFGRVEGIAPEANILTVKALSTLGFGTSFGIIKAMEVAYERGAKVVSMSLGGPLQGSIFDDPEIKVVEGLSKTGMIFVIAAGNEGPDEYTIASPAAAPSAVTVGAYSLTDQATSWFSSRGPQGAYYKETPGELDRATQAYGDDALKPDCVAPGGGRSREEATPDEVLYSGSTGWFDGFYDLLTDSFEGMHGTSQATPLIAGLITLLVQGGLVNRASDFKAVLKDRGHLKTVEDGYGLPLLSMFVRIT